MANLTICTMTPSTLTLERWIEVAISVLVFILTVTLGGWLIRLIFSNVISRLTGFTKTTLDDAILNAIAPLYWLAVIYGVVSSMIRYPSRARPPTGDL